MKPVNDQPSTIAQIAFISIYIKGKWKNKFTEFYITFKDVAT